MIAYVNGVVEDIGQDNVVVDVGGVGVNVKISADTASRLPGPGEQVKLYTYTSVREDAFWLYGFLSRNDLEIFKKCITVSGIGPKGALSILSVLDADSLRFAILTGDARTIARAPGVGTKTAERLILELKGKLDISDALISREAAVYQGTAPQAGESLKKREAAEALVSLGYAQAEAVKAINAVPDGEELETGALLKAALKFLF